MADIRVSGSNLVVDLSDVEQLAAMRRTVSVPVTAVTNISVETQPWRAIRGIRAPGTAWPGAVAYGTWRHRQGRDFVAVHGRGPAVRVDIGDAGEWRRILVSCRDAQAVVDGLRANPRFQGLA